MCFRSTYWYRKNTRNTFIPALSKSPERNCVLHSDNSENCCVFKFWVITFINADSLLSIFINVYKFISIISKPICLNYIALLFRCKYLLPENDYYRYLILWRSQIMTGNTRILSSALKKSCEQITGIINAIKIRDASIFSWEILDFPAFSIYTSNLLTYAGQRGLLDYYLTGRDIYFGRKVKHCTYMLYVDLFHWIRV